MLKYDWDSISELFGLVPDGVIAEILGSTQVSVTIERNSRDIQPYNGKNSGRSTIWHPVVAQLLFQKYTDKEIKEIFNIQSEDHVRARRTAHTMLQRK